MQVNFLGANHEVTGSCHYLNVCGKHVVVDCGMEQGPNFFKNQELPIDPSEVDYVLLTHAHIDHTGLLPLLNKEGFSGEVFATKPTVDLCNIMLRDSAHIQMFEAEWRNRKAKRSGQEKFIPLYTWEDAERVIKKLNACPYDSKIELFEGFQIRFIDAGHLLGSASIEIWAEEEGEKRKIVFSGDIGNLNQPIIKDPSYIKEADYVVMESTYGDSSHGERPDYLDSLTKVIQETFDKGGNVVIPAFAVGRTQELLYFIRSIKENKRIVGHDGFEVYLDSPLAIEATDIFEKNRYHCFDEEAMELMKKGINPIKFEGLRLSITSDDSKAINFDSHPKVIISASGMCEAGRIRHHLKHNLWRPECTVLFAGYQSAGTLGRILLDGVETVKLFGEKIEVKARITKLEGFSGHADKEGLIKWITAIEKKPKKVFIVHGEDSVSASFGRCLKEEHGLDSEIPYSGSVFDLVKNVWVVEAEPVRIEKKDNASLRTKEIFERLLSSGQRLLGVIRKNRGISNKDMVKFKDQIDSISDKWDR